MIIEGWEWSAWIHQVIFTDLIAFHNELTFLEDMGRAAVVFDLDFSNVFITVSRKIFTEKLINYGLDEPNSSEN